MRRIPLAVALGALSAGMLAGCGPAPWDCRDPGEVCGRAVGTSDVAGQPGGWGLGGGGLAVIPLAAMESNFWRMTGQVPVADPQSWSHVSGRLSVAQVTLLGGDVVEIGDDGFFRVVATPGDYAVCYWSNTIGGRFTGCGRILLPMDGRLEASWGEAGFTVITVD